MKSGGGELWCGLCYMGKGMRAFISKCVKVCLEVWPSLSEGTIWCFGEECEEISTCRKTLQGWKSCFKSPSIQKYTFLPVTSLGCLEWCMCRVWNLNLEFILMNCLRVGWDLNQLLLNISPTNEMGSNILPESWVKQGNVIDWFTFQHSQTEGKRSQIY